MRSPTFSIITPSYNQGEFVEDTIRSVLSQEGGFYIEYIVMDGGSTDNSVEVIKKYDSLLRDGKWPVKCLGITYSWKSEKDKGQSDAIEKGFDAARGEIAGWLNSDDIYYDSRVFEKVMKEFMEDGELKMVTGDGLFIDRGGKEIGPHCVDRIDFNELLYLDYHILQPATFVVKSIYKGERLDRSYDYCFDAEYFIRLINKGCKYKKLGSSLACFRFYPEIKTLSGLGKRYSESLRISRVYGRNTLYYIISAFYKYWAIVLVNKYPSGLIRKATALFRILAYNIISGKVR